MLDVEVDGPPWYGTGEQVQTVSGVAREDDDVLVRTRAGPRGDYVSGALVGSGADPRQVALAAMDAGVVGHRSDRPLRLDARLPAAARLAA